MKEDPKQIRNRWLWKSRKSFDQNRPKSLWNMMLITVWKGWRLLYMNIYTELISHNGNVIGLLCFCSSNKAISTGCRLSMIDDVQWVVTHRAHRTHRTYRTHRFDDAYCNNCNMKPVFILIYLISFYLIYINISSRFVSSFWFGFGLRFTMLQQQ